jgi:MFS family permease
VKSLSKTPHQRQRDTSAMKSPRAGGVAESSSGPRTPGDERGRSGLTRYLAAATLARGADGGAAVGLVLLATMPAAHLQRPATVGGLLAACLTAPHLLGPAVARRLDRARDGRPVLAGSCVIYGGALAAATLGIGHAPLPVIAACVVVAGACGPLLTGGLSSRLAGLVEPDERSQGRAQGWDAVTYGIGGSAGPAVVAAVAAAASPRVAMGMLTAASLLAAVLTLTLHAGDGPRAREGPALTVRQTLRLIAVDGPLRRVTYATMVVAIPGGAVAVLAVALGQHLGASAASGALLVAAFGIGNLAGSLLVTAFPLTGEPERLATGYAVVVAGAFALCAVVPSFPAAIAAFGLAGAANAPFFTATLAARSAYAPPGGRAQIFVSVAGLKVAAASLGTAVAGSIVGYGPRLALLLGAGLTLAVVVATVVDRHVQPPLGAVPDGEGA